jgi:hypothetical protein
MSTVVAPAGLGFLLAGMAVIGAVNLYLGMAMAAIGLFLLACSQ